MNDTDSADVNTADIDQETTPVDAAPASDAVASQVDCSDEGPCRKRLRIEVPQETVAKELEKNFRQLRETVQLPGFRKGKAPFSLLKKRFGEQVQDDVREDLIGRAIEEQFESAEWKPLGTPEFEKIEFSEGEKFTFEAVFDIQPIFELPDYKGIKITAESVAVEESEVDREVEMICEQSSSLEPMAVGEQCEGDFAVVDLALIIEEEPIFERQEVMIKIGDNKIDSMEIPELGQSLAKAGQDEVIEKSVQVPDDFPEADHREKAATLRLTIKDAKKKITPELDAAFLEKLGVESEDDLRGKVRENLEQRRTAQEETRQEDLISEQVGNSVEMDLPDAMIAQRLESKVQRRAMELVQGGKTEEEARSEAEQDKDIEAEARQELTRIFVLDRLADEEKVFVTEDEVVQRLQAIATTYQQPLEQVVEQYRRGGMLPELRNGMRREKVKQVLRKKAKISGA
ncbi:MAG: trigger factor [Planctomycetota bacterium]|nr:trigger factor [Planctomycetota bacterium]